MRRKWKILFCLYLIFVCSLFPKSGAQAGIAENKRVLFISSYSYGWDTVQLQIEGIKKGLDDDVILDYEFMDTKRVDDETSWQLFYEGLAYRLSKVEKYDVVILGDDAALKFAMEYQEELFDGIPLVFEGVNDEKLAAEAAENPMISGIIEKLSFQKNIDLALTIYPKAEKVVGIMDDSLTGEAERKKFYENAADYPQLEFSEINSSRLTTEELRLALKNIQPNTILIYVVMTEDASGKKYTNRESCELIRKYASVPAFRMVDGGIGMGLLGGNIVSMEQSGQEAAKIAMDILKRGVAVEDMDVYEESPNIYCIDEQLMKEFGIPKKLMPEGTIFLNHKETYFERNREALKQGGVLVAAILIALVFMLIDNLKKRKLTRELETARRYLQDASQHDFLTGLPNRSKFMGDLQNLMEEGKACTVVMVDIDNFKGINDSLGHLAGDEALRQIAERLKKLQTPLLTPYRFAGDEFIVIIESTNSRIVEKSAFQCVQLFEKTFNLLGNVRQITGSIGVASSPQDTKDMEQLIVYADAAMYEVKKSGKNSYAFYHDIRDGQNTRI